MEQMAMKELRRIIPAITVGAMITMALLLPACSSASSQSTCSPCQQPLAEPGYPWPGTETVTRIEFEQGPLQR
jgi:hypothetical protein